MEKNGYQIDNLYKNAFTAYVVDAPANAYANVRKKMFWVKFWQLGLHVNVYMVAALVGLGSWFVVSGQENPVGEYQRTGVNETITVDEKANIEAIDFKNLNQDIKTNQATKTVQPNDVVESNKTPIITERTEELDKMDARSSTIDNEEISKSVRGGVYYTPVKKKKKIRVDD